MKDSRNTEPSNDTPDKRRAADESEFSINEGLIPKDARLTQAQRLEAERRLLEYEANPESYSTWEEVKRRLEFK
jgi:putative addiction module component (TIGR02574 family)